MAETNKERRQRRAHAGLSRELEQTRDTADSDPLRGGSRGYPLWTRLDAIKKVQNLGLAAASLILKPSASTLRSCLTRVEPYEMHGGQERTKLVGHDQLLMAIYLVAYPDAERDEIAAFIVNSGGQLYSQSTISRRLKELKYTRKVASVEAYQAFLPANILKKERFFALPPPLGVNGLERRSLVDADECAIFLEKTNRTKGLAHTSIRVRKPGHYGKGKKLTVICFIEPGDPALPAHIAGSVANPRRWFYFLEDGGTTAEVFAACVDTVLTSMEGSGLIVDLNRTMMWDNLRSHLAPLVTQTVYIRPPPFNNQFRCVPRPPYMPKYGPIEYVFDELGGRLQQRVQPNWNFAILRQVVTTILSELGRDGRFDATFAHCGY